MSKSVVKVDDHVFFETLPHAELCGVIVRGCDRRERRKRGVLWMHKGVVYESKWSVVPEEVRLEKRVIERVPTADNRKSNLPVHPLRGSKQHVLTKNAEGAADPGEYVLE